MKVVNYEIEVLADNCTGCYLCEQICPTGAMVMVGPKSKALAVVDNDKCVACFRCVDICQDDALLAPRRATPLVFGTDPASADQAAIMDLCDRAKIDPNRVACPCSSTSVREVAAAILNGAHTMEDVALKTAVQSGCLMYCFAPVHRLLVTFLGQELEPLSKNKFYNTSYVLDDVPDHVAERHPRFYIAEEKLSLQELRAAATP
jgi:Fe-S-cluster-containing hydrogenase component 2